MRIEKSSQGSKDTDYSMITNETKNSKVLNRKSYRPLSMCAKNLINTIKQFLNVWLVLILLIVIAVSLEKNNTALAETMTIYTQDALDANNNGVYLDRHPVPYTVVINFIGDNTGDWTAEQKEAVMQAFRNLFYDVSPTTTGFNRGDIANDNTNGVEETRYVYDVKWGDIPNDVASNRVASTSRTYTTTETDSGNPLNTANDKTIHYEITFSNTLKDQFSDKTKGQLMRDKLKDDGTTYRYNLFVQTLKELGHLLGLNAGINAAGTGFDGSNNYYRSNLRNYDGSGSVPAYPLTNFADWDNYNGIWFEGANAMQIYNDRPINGTTSYLIPIGDGGTSPISPDAVLNHIDQSIMQQIMGTDTFPVMGWNLTTVNTRPFLSALELAMLQDSGAFGLSSEFGINQHFGRSVYQQHGKREDPFMLVYDWNQNDKANRVKGDYYERYDDNGNLIPGDYAYNVADYGVGLHIVSSDNFLAYSGTIIAGDQLGNNTARAIAKGSANIGNGTGDNGLRAYYRSDYAASIADLELLTSFSAGIRIEGQNNYLSILHDSVIEGQFGVLVAAGSTTTISEIGLPEYGLNLISNTVLINHGEIRSLQDWVLVLPSWSGRTDPYTELEYHPDDLYHYDTDSFTIRGQEGAPTNFTINDNNYFRAGIYLEAGAAEINMVGAATLYNGIYIDEGAEIRNGMNLISNLEHPEFEIELHGNFINNKYNEIFAPAVLTSGKKANADHEGPQKAVEDYTVQWIDAYKNDKLIIAVYDSANKFVQYTTGNYDADNNLYTDIIDYNDSTKYNISAVKINSGIENQTDVVANIYGDFYGNWQFEAWGGTTNFYIPNIRLYGSYDVSNGIRLGTELGTSENITKIITNTTLDGRPYDYVQIDYSDVNFIIGADDKGASYLPYDPKYREQGSYATVHLSVYDEADDKYDKYYENPSGYYGILNFDYGDDAYYIFDKVQFGSKNNTGSILEGHGLDVPNSLNYPYSYTNAGYHTVSIEVKSGIDNWITIKDFYRIEATGQPDNIYRIFNNPNDQDKVYYVDFAEPNSILQGFFRDPNSLPYLKDRNHWTEIEAIYSVNDKLVAEMESYNQSLGELSLFNRYSGVIRDNAHIVTIGGLWVDRDETTDFGNLYGQIINNDSLQIGTFIENYGHINNIGGEQKVFLIDSTYVVGYNGWVLTEAEIANSGLSYSDAQYDSNGNRINYDGIWAGTYIYNAYNAQMNDNLRIVSGTTTDEELRASSFLYIINGGEIKRTLLSVVAETDLINLITGEISDTNLAVIAKRDLYNFGKIYNTAASNWASSNPELPNTGSNLSAYNDYADYYRDVLLYREVDGGIYTLDGNIYNFETGEMFGNRHILAWSEDKTEDKELNVRYGHRTDRLVFGTSGNLVNMGQIGYSFGIERYYDASVKTSKLLLASIDTEFDLINFSEGDIFDTTYIKVGRDLYNENTAQIRNTSYLEVTLDLINRDYAELYNTSYLYVKNNLRNEGNAVIDAGTYLQVYCSLYNGTDIIMEDDLIISHLAVIKNFAEIEIDNGNLHNGKYGLITDNNIILAKQPVLNQGIIEKFFDFTAKQTLKNEGYGIINVVQDSSLTVSTDIINEDKGRFFVFGNVNAGKVENVGYVHGTGTITLKGTKNIFNNNLGGHLSPGGAIVLHPATITDDNPVLLQFGSEEIGKLTIEGNLYNNNGTFDININSNQTDRPLDGNIGDNDIVYVKKIYDPNGKDLGGGYAIINGGEVHPYFYSNNPLETMYPARYKDGTKIFFLTTESGLTVNDPLQESTYTDANQISKKYTEDILLFDFTLDYDAYSYWFTIDRKYKYGNVVNQTYNQRSIGKYVDLTGGDPNPDSDFFSALIALDNLSTANNTANKSYKTRDVSRSALFALDQLSGSIYATMETASFQNITTIISQLSDYLRTDPLLTYCKEHRIYEPSKLNIWGTVYGTLGGSDHDGNAYGYDQSTGGTLIGFDRLYINRLRAGVFGSFGSSTYSTDLLERSKATDLSVGFYMRKELNRGYLLSTLGFGFTDYHTTRQISFVGRRAKSDRNAYFWSMSIERALDLDSQIGRIQPYVGGQYIGNQFDNFNETGAGTLSLKGNSSDAHSLRSLLGVRFTRRPRMVRGGQLESFVNFDWRQELLRYTKGSLKAQFTNPNFANFSGAGIFQVYGNKQSRSWLDAGFGSNWVRNNTRFSLGYNIGINSDAFFLHTGNIAFVYAR
ncbi:MAG: autotransporter outer membrane beta-barrel domain-containing protein [Planctomycetaceae bacterium]|jgi:uncharacterized protein YhjY with autotransporter beta-barrel domain|nr:autotransporter outer membrane beta-barrel domain-containing protein [Planctomycetaceae bacterium]